MQMQTETTIAKAEVHEIPVSVQPKRHLVTCYENVLLFDIAYKTCGSNANVGVTPTRDSPAAFRHQLRFPCSPPPLNEQASLATACKTYSNGRYE